MLYMYTIISEQRWLVSILNNRDLWRPERWRLEWLHRLVHICSTHMSIHECFLVCTFLLIYNNSVPYIFLFFPRSKSRDCAVRHWQVRWGHHVFRAVHAAEPPLGRGTKVPWRYVQTCAQVRMPDYVKCLAPEPVLVRIWISLAQVFKIQMCIVTEKERYMLVLPTWTNKPHELYFFCMQIQRGGICIHMCMCVCTFMQVGRRDIHVQESTEDSAGLLWGFEWSGALCVIVCADDGRFWAVHVITYVLDSQVHSLQHTCEWDKWSKQFSRLQKQLHKELKTGDADYTCYLHAWMCVPYFALHV